MDYENNNLNSNTTPKPEQPDAAGSEKPAQNESAGQAQPNAANNAGQANAPYTAPNPNTGFYGNPHYTAQNPNGAPQNA